jgi:hypothetical protein
MVCNNQNQNVLEPRRAVVVVVVEMRLESEIDMAEEDRWRASQSGFQGEQQTAAAILHCWTRKSSDR